MGIRVVQELRVRVENNIRKFAIVKCDFWQINLKVENFEKIVISAKNKFLVKKKIKLFKLWSEFSGLCLIGTRVPGQAWWVLL